MAGVKTARAEANYFAAQAGPDAVRDLSQPSRQNDNARLSAPAVPVWVFAGTACPGLGYPDYLWPNDGAVGRSSALGHGAHLGKTTEYTGDSWHEPGVRGTFSGWKGCMSGGTSELTDEAVIAKVRAAAGADTQVAPITFTVRRGATQRSQSSSPQAALGAQALSVTVSLTAAASRTLKHGALLPSGPRTAVLSTQNFSLTCGKRTVPALPAQLDLRESLDRGDVVLFRLEADRRPLAAEMLGAAIVQDLVAISQERQHGEHRPALVIIDEFSAFGAPQTRRLFGRGRGAWLSQLLGTQEVADLGPNDTNVLGGGGGILAQVAGNIEVLLCGRQNMPASAELVAAIAGTRGAWITTEQTHAPAAGLLTGLGSRSRGREYVVHPDTIKRLDVGEFVVIEPRLGRAVIVRVFHPDELRRHGVEC
jgi:hypothetical protein